MKLINIYTHEIVVFGEGVVDLNKIGCKNVAEMIEAGWEDYEGPKEHWYYDTALNEIKKTINLIDPGVDPDKLIGNYFETKEEAEKAVEKLKAWKRLKDNGFKFYSYYLIAGDDDETKVSGKLGLSAECLNHVDRKDLDLLFSGGEE